MPNIEIKKVHGVTVEMQADGRFVAQIGNRWVHRASLADMERVIVASITVPGTEIDALIISGMGGYSRFGTTSVKLVSMERRRGETMFRTDRGDWIGGPIYHRDEAKEKELHRLRERAQDLEQQARDIAVTLRKVTAADFTATKT